MNNNGSIKLRIPTISISNSLEFLVKYYYVFVIILYFNTFRSNDFRVGFYSSIIMVVIIGIMILKNGIHTRLKGLEGLVFLYLIYCILTVQNYFLFGIPIASFIETASNSLFPIVFFWCGLNSLCFSKRAYLLFFDIMCLVGVYLTFALPDWYYDFCVSHGFSYTRLSSCVGSTALGSLSCIAIIYSYDMIMVKRNRLSIVQFIMSCGFALLSFQRSAWIVSIISVFVLNYYLVKWKYIKIQTIIFEILLIIVAVFIFRDWIFNRFDLWILQRSTGLEENGLVDAGMFTEMFSGRVGQWVTAISKSNWIMGSGFGTRGHRTVSVGVADGDYARMVCEIGIIGVTIFALIIVNSIKIGKKYKKKAIIPVFVVIVMALQAIGSNIFEFQITSPFFWMAVGELAKIKKDFYQEDVNCANTIILSSSVSRN